MMENDKNYLIRPGTHSQGKIISDLKPLLQAVLSYLLAIDKTPSVKKSKSNESQKEKKKTGLLAKSMPNKNFPKSLGNMFCNYLIKNRDFKDTEELRGLLKENLSWLKINNGLAGIEILIPGGSPQLFSKLFKEFILELDPSLVNKSKLELEIVKDCYKVIIRNLQKALKYAIQELESQQKTLFGCSIVRVWPFIEIDISQAKAIEHS